MRNLLILKTCLQYEMVIVLWVSLCRLDCAFYNSIYFNAHIMLYLGPFYYFYHKSYRAMLLYF